MEIVLFAGETRKNWCRFVIMNHIIAYSTENADRNLDECSDVHITFRTISYKPLHEDILFHWWHYPLTFVLCSFVIKALLLFSAHVTSSLIWRRSSGACLRESLKQDIQHLWMTSTQRSSSQREAVERSTRNMRSDWLKQLPGNQPRKKHQSNVKTSLNPYLDEINQSEQ